MSHEPDSLKRAVAIDPDSGEILVNGRPLPPNSKPVESPDEGRWFILKPSRSAWGDVDIVCGYLDVQLAEVQISVGGYSSLPITHELHRHILAANLGPPDLDGEAPVWNRTWGSASALFDRRRGYYMIRVVYPEPDLGAPASAGIPEAD